MNLGLRSYADKETFRMTTLVIGDIHGCYVELQALLDKAGVGDDDLILAVGDIVRVSVGALVRPPSKRSCSLKRN